MDRTFVFGAVTVAAIIGVIVWAAWRRKNDTRTALLRELARFRGLKRLVSVIVWFFTGLSIWLNIANAPNNVSAYIVAGMIPAAVLGNVELLSRIPTTSKWLSRGRIAAALAVGGLAVRLSYMHQQHYVQSIGYEGLDAAFIPLIIDGSMIVAVLSLVEVARKVRELEEQAYPSGVPARTGTAGGRATEGKAVVSAGRQGPRGDYGPRSGDEYSDGHQRARARQGKPRTTPARKPRRRSAAKPTPAPAPAPAAVVDIPVSPGVGPIDG